MPLDLPPISAAVFFLIFSSWPSHAHNCSRQAVLRIDPDTNHAHKPDFCVRAATVRSAFAMQAFANGSCQLIYACSAVAPTAQPALYMRLRPATPVLLLRTIADTQPHAYDLLTTGTPDTTHVTLTSLLGTRPYMSALVAMEPSLFSRVRVQLFPNASLTPAVDLTFTAESTGAIKQGEWFSKHQLEAAFPWDVNVMKSDTYKVFSMDRWGRRKFLILTSGGICGQYTGYMYLYKYDGEKLCSYDSGRFVNTDYYFYARNGPKRFSSADSSELFEFRIVGEVASASAPVYVRVDV